MADILIYSTEYGETLQVRTWLADIVSASAITIEMRKCGTSTTASLTATVISTYPAGTTEDPIVATEYGVETIIESAWAATRVGTWICQVKALFPTATLYGTPFTVQIKAVPTA